VFVFTLLHEPQISLDLGRLAGTSEICVDGTEVERAARRIIRLGVGLGPSHMAATRVIDAITRDK
jgi:hypothetical protein